VAHDPRRIGAERTILHGRPVRSDDEISLSFLGQSLRHIRYWSLALAGAIIGIIPILLVVFVIIEFHSLNGFCQQ
jgi:ABC-type glycerol-3-phosphate transport system permease component